MANHRALAVAHPDGIKEAVGLASGLHFYGHFQQATGRMPERSPRSARGEQLTKSATC